MGASGSGENADAATAVEPPASVTEQAGSRALGGIGDHLGRYVVLEELGRGAMGRVVRAYDPKLQREVALKEVRRQLLDDDGAARLVTEARAMAKLSHPNVVGVYDVEEHGRGAGHEFVLVMEYVAGATLQQWLEARRPPWREIVGSFIEAGRGLVAAHAAGVLHRDFKPANVLVGTVDRVAGGAAAIVKVTDFGLAKRVEHPSDPSPRGASAEPGEVETAEGMVLGTPRYMAPEQHRGDDLTAAADQYAYCVALWEALCGTPPFAVGTGTFGEVTKRLAADKHAGPPPWTHAAVPKPIADAIRRGLCPLPEARWPDMAALLAALSFEPGRRTRQWALALSGVAAIGVAIGVGRAWSNTEAQRCSGALDQLRGAWDDDRRAAVEAALLAVDASYAATLWDHLAARLDGYADEWAALHTDACEATTIRGEQSATVMDLRMTCLHRANVELGAVTRLLAEADSDVVARAHEVVAGLPALSRCADVAALQADVEPPAAEEAEVVGAVRALLAEANAQKNAGRYAAARQTADRAAEVLGDAQYEPIHASLALTQGSILQMLGEHDAADAKLNEALMLGARAGDREVMRSAATGLMYVVGSQQQRAAEALRYRALAAGLSHGVPTAEATFRNSLGGIFYTEGKFAEALAEYQAAAALREAALGPEHPDVPLVLHNVGTVLQNLGRIDEAEQTKRRVLASWEAQLGPEHPFVARARKSLAEVLAAQGKFTEAEAEGRAALAATLEALGPRHPAVADAHHGLANLLEQQGRFTEAEAEYRVALRVRVAAHGPDHVDVGTEVQGLGNVLNRQGRFAEAETEYRAVLVQWENAHGPDHPDIAMVRFNLAVALAQQNKYADAEAQMRRSIDIWIETLGPEHPQIAGAYNNLGVMLASQGKFEQAEVEDRKALALWEKSLPPEHPNLARARYNLGRHMIERGKFADARELVDKAWARVKAPDVPASLRGETGFALARILWETSKDPAQRTRARALAQGALKDLEVADDANPDDVVAARTWVAEHGG